MENDKSTTHYLVEKNGHQTWFLKEIWDSRTDHAGFVKIPTAPVEVMELAKKINEKPAMEVKKKDNKVKDDVTGI